MARKLGLLGVVVLVLAGCWGSPTVPPPVTGLQASSSTTSVTLTWTKPAAWPAAASGAVVRRAVGATPPSGPTDGTLVADVWPDSTVTDRGLNPSTTYSYAVFAYVDDNSYASPAAITTSTIAATGNAVLGPTGRPATLVEPATVTPLAPLVVLLHGYSSNASAQDSYLGVTAQAASRGLYVLLPNGTIDPTGHRAWNAGMFPVQPSADDVGYLRDLIAQAIAVRPIDPDRVYVFGHSNGGAMAYRLACEIPDRVTAIATLAGPLVTGLACQPSQPVSVLSLHGDADEVVFYNGGTAFGNYGGFVFQLPSSPYPGALDQLAQWGSRNGCSTQTVPGTRIDFVAALAGTETAVTAHQGCPQGIDVQLDTIESGTHIPNLIQAQVGTHILDWLLTH